MREHPACPHCGQRMMYMRAGARLSPQKARIFDVIKRAGAGGISGDDIIESLRLEIGKNCLRAHVWQINEILQRFGAEVHIVAYGSKLFRMIDERKENAGQRKTALAKEKRI